MSPTAFSATCWRQHSWLELCGISIFSRGNYRDMDMPRYDLTIAIFDTIRYIVPSLVLSIYWYSLSLSCYILLLTKCRVYSSRELFCCLVCTVTGDKQCFWSTSHQFWWRWFWWVHCMMTSVLLSSSNSMWRCVKFHNSPKFTVNFTVDSQRKYINVIVEICNILLLLSPRPVYTHRAPFLPTTASFAFWIKSNQQWLALINFRIGFSDCLPHRSLYHLVIYSICRYGKVKYLHSGRPAASHQYPR